GVVERKALGQHAADLVLTDRSQVRIERVSAADAPSAMQVRQPLRRDTVHSARYGALLDPLRDALGLPRWQDETSA
ncbi:MAG: hypothetical protein B7X33_04875, partial [Lysobacterales bacterium 13-68-4]